jgi:hypothetical protein
MLVVVSNNGALGRYVQLTLRSPGHQHDTVVNRGRLS